MKGASDEGPAAIPREWLLAAVVWAALPGGLTAQARPSTPLPSQSPPPPGEQSAVVGTKGPPATRWQLAVDAGASSGLAGIAPVASVALRVADAAPLAPLLALRWIAPSRVGEGLRGSAYALALDLAGCPVASPLFAVCAGLRGALVVARSAFEDVTSQHDEQLAVYALTHLQGSVPLGPSLGLRLRVAAGIAVSRPSFAFPDSSGEGLLRLFESDFWLWEAAVGFRVPLY